MAKKKRNIPQQIFLWVFQIVIVVLFAFVLVYFFGQTRTCIGQSMSVTIEGGDTVLLDGLSYKIEIPKMM
ncbi:MAG: S26 family signal peptidase [Blautia sp.]